ncbi:MAG: ATP-binding cassette domain-containing protein [Nitriliruptorales bacterium]|nr:ATP-binding cassette domain-containing protein [Nitriliruptorales bacterium]
MTPGDTAPRLPEVDVIGSTRGGGTLLRVEGIRKTYPRMRLPALDGIDLTMHEGEFVSLIGPSGCGKTTLLRIVAGLTPAGAGQVLVDGRPSEGPSREKALVFQQFNLFPWRTAIANAAYGLELQGMSRKDAREKGLEYLTLLGLDRFADHYPGEMSGGMQQRVGIARALAIEPRLLLMDEPFGALDALTRERLQSELLRICDARDLTVLFVTHSIDEAIFLSDRVLAMGVEPGRVVEEFDVDLPRPRVDYDVHSNPEYARIRNEAWTILAAEMERQGGAAE